MKIRTHLSICAVLAAFITVAANSSSGQQSTGSTRELGGSVEAAGKPIAGGTVTLYAAGTGAPAKLAEAKTDESGPALWSWLAVGPRPNRPVWRWAMLSRRPAAMLVVGCSWLRRPKTLSQILSASLPEQL